MMKKYTLLAFILFLSIISLSAQPVLRGQAFANVKGKIIDMSFSNLSSNNVFTVPTGGANQVYDYSKLTYLSPASYPLSPVNISTLPEATHVDLDYNDYISSSTLLARYDQLLKIDTSGVTYLGWRVNGVAIPLAQTTGNSKDSIIIKDQISRFNTPITIQKFPMTMGQLINSGAPTYLDYSGTVSVAAYNLSNAPFVRRRYTIYKDSVVGWGILKRTNPLSFVTTDSILLSNRTVVFRDSFFLNGQPAPATLLAAFGATQGRVDSFGRINSWRTGRPYSIFTVVYDIKTKVFSSGNFEWSTPLSTGIHNVLPEANWSVSPNPVLNNNMSVKYDAIEPVQLTIYDMKGNIIQNLKLPENPSGESANLDLNNDFNNGMYILKMNNSKEQKTVKILVNK